MSLGNAIEPNIRDGAAAAELKPDSPVRTAATIFLLIVLQLPLTGWLVPGKSFAAEVGREGVFWALTLGLVAYVLFVEKRLISSIGMKRLTWKSLALGLAGALVMVAGFVFIYVVVFPAMGVHENEAGMKALKATPLWFRILLAGRAAVFEETYYRGFAIERITELTGLRWLAALISLAAFTFAHLSYWGWAHLILAAFGGVVLTGLYWWRRDLGCNMIAHFFTDGLGFLFG